MTEPTSHHSPGHRGSQQHTTDTGRPRWRRAIHLAVTSRCRKWVATCVLTDYTKKVHASISRATTQDRLHITRRNRGAPCRHQITASLFFSSLLFASALSPACLPFCAAHWPSHAVRLPFVTQHIRPFGWALYKVPASSCIPQPGLLPPSLFSSLLLPQRSSSLLFSLFFFTLYPLLFNFYQIHFFFS